MKIEISQHSAGGVRDALARRGQLLRMTTHEMSTDWLHEMARPETTIAAAVAKAVRVQPQ
jgi:hypothetical protein